MGPLNNALLRFPLQSSEIATVVVYVPMRALQPRSYVQWFVGLYGMGTLLTRSIYNIHRIQQNPSRSCHSNLILTAEDSTEVSNPGVVCYKACSVLFHLLACRRDLFKYKI